MTVQLAGTVAGALAVGTLLAGLAVPGVATAQAVADEDAFRSFVEGVQNGTLSPALATRECQRELAANEGVESVRQIMAGYLKVPEGRALTAFCEALVRAAGAGDVTTETGAVLGRQQMDADFFQSFGSMLRAVHFAHHLTVPGSVAETPKP